MFWLERQDAVVIEMGVVNEMYSQLSISYIGTATQLETDRQASYNTPSVRI